MSILEKIEYHFQNKKFVRLSRKVSENLTLASRGYIVDFSAGYIILQETDDFRVLGYLILPVSQITEIRFNSSDRFYDKIMRLEGEKEKVGITHQIDLTNWQTIFKSIKKIKLDLAVECEQPDIDSFTIGPVVRITKTFIYILYYNASGFIDTQPTSIDYESITKVMFDDRYINIFKKYVREKKGA